MKICYVVHPKKQVQTAVCLSLTGSQWKAVCFEDLLFSNTPDLLLVHAPWAQRVHLHCPILLLGFPEFDPKRPFFTWPFISCNFQVQVLLERMDLAYTSYLARFPQLSDNLNFEI